MKNTRNSVDPILINPGRKAIFEEGRQTKFFSKSGIPKREFAKFVFLKVDRLIAKKFSSLLDVFTNNRFCDKNNILWEQAMYVKALYGALSHVAPESYRALLLRKYVVSEDVLLAALALAGTVMAQNAGESEYKTFYKKIHKQVLNNVLCAIKQEKQYIDRVKKMEVMKEKYVIAKYRPSGNLIEYRWLHRSVIDERNKICLIIANNEGCTAGYVLSGTEKFYPPLYRGVIVVYMRQKYSYFSYGLLSFLIHRTPTVVKLWFEQYEHFRQMSERTEEANKFFFLLGIVKAKMKKW